MKLFLDYISKIKFYIILQLFPVMLAEIIFFLYQLPIEPMVYVTVFWLITGICACLNGFYRYRKKVEQLELIPTGNYAAVKSDAYRCGECQPEGI